MNQSPPKNPCEIFNLSLRPRALGNQAAATAIFEQAVLTANRRPVKDPFVERLGLYLVKKNQAKKRYWIHPLFLKGHSKGSFYNYFKDVHIFPDRFF